MLDCNATRKGSQNSSERARLEYIYMLHNFDQMYHPDSPYNQGRGGLD